MVLAYVLGLVTLPVLAGLVFAGYLLFSRSNQAMEACEHCIAADIRTSAYTFFERRNIRVWVSDAWHYHATSRRAAHRVAWQAKFATYIVDGNRYEFYAPLQGRFGNAA